MLLIILRGERHGREENFLKFQAAKLLQINVEQLTNVSFCSVASMRLAYKELEIDRKMDNKKMQNMEGKKREQAERLGMGFGNRR